MKKLFLASFAILLMTSCATMTDDTAAGGGATAAGTGWMSDSDVAAILAAANEGEIQQGQVASQRATSTDARAFGQMMVTDHTAAMQRATDVFTRAGITPSENDISRTLRENSRISVTNLQRYEGAALDRAYLQTQVELHRWLLSAIDVMMPQTRNAQVRTLMQELRPSVAAHLERAQALAR